MLLAAAVVVGAWFLWFGGGRDGARAVRPALEPALDGAVLSRDFGLAAEVGLNLDAEPATDAVALRRAVEVLGEAGASRAADASAATLVGRIVDAQGKSIAGATVRLADSVKALGSKSSPRARFAASDVEGAFRIDCDAGPAYLLIQAPGFVPTTIERILVTRGETTELEEDIVLERSVVLTGVVLDDNEVPIEDALVTVRGVGLREIRTPADGSFRLDQLERDRLQFVVTHAEHVSHVENVDAMRLAEQPHVVIRLSRGLVIEGRLEGVPAAATGPWSVTTEPQYDRNTLITERRSSPVAPDGRFELRGLTDGSHWRLFALPTAALDDETSRERVSEILVAKAGQRDVVLNWQAEGSLGFRVVDAHTQQPIEWLAVRATMVRYDSPLNADRADVSRYENGNVRLDGLRWSEHEPPLWLEVDAVGYGNRFEKHVEVKPGQLVDLGTIELVPAPRMSITVLDDATGRPVVGAEVGWTEQDMDRVGVTTKRAPGAWRQRSRGYSASRTLRTDDGGIVAFDGPPNFYVELTVTAPGYASALESAWKLPAAGEARRIVRLQPGGVVDVHVVDASGRGQAGRTVEQRLSGPKWSHRKSERLPFAIDPTGSDVVTDSQGRARFESLDPGRHEFRLRARTDTGALGERLEPSARDYEDSWAIVDVAAGDPYQLVLDLPPRGVLFGRITERGRPLSGARAALFSKTDFAENAEQAVFLMQSHDATLTTDAVGRYRFDEVPPDEYVLVVTHPERATSDSFDVTVPAGESQRDFDLDVAAIAGRVIDSNGFGVAGISVWVEPVGATAERGFERRLEGIFVDIQKLGAGASTLTDAAGAYELRGVATDVELRVTTDGASLGWQPARSKPLSVSVDERLSDVDIEIQRAGSLEVSFRRTDGIPTPALFHLRRVDGTEPKVAADFQELDWRSYYGTTGLLEGLAPGRWRLLARYGAPGQPEATREVVILAGETLAVEMILPL